ncbi:Homeodomain-like domain-containing protein [Thermoanaerobacter uzonensis DSM 18761]|uniref:Homeodomain-like domain-containing protein n=1 Tax=Thermoanaerobacter uzonensis DSM 18761 TaxID=1123369 RepID=A0A1M4XNG2_9THEO|nr:helix-turn-helix domain-containing protein [Thermoanaerobacter uzonensis]SHE94971.1 Homeodomain-like domain-containing protein [Thermoanaerobacter uzonensis DSM 18761]
MDKKAKALELYLEGFKVVEIAKELGVSQPAVTKMLKQFPEYHQEKERRKKENQEKARQWRNEYKKQKREQYDEDYELVLKSHREDAAALSRRGKLSDDILIKLCILNYDYNKEKERLVFNESAGKRPADLPRSVYVHKNVLKQFRIPTRQ